MLTNKKVVEKIQKAEKIAIFAHREPDPDACGAMFSLRDFCKSFDKKADVFAVKENEDYLSYIFPISEFKKDFHASDYDLVILTDIHKINRTDEIFWQELEKCQNILIVDHHQVLEDENFNEKNSRIITKASASQLVLDLYRSAQLELPKRTATYIYAGLMGDTNRFLNSNLSKSVFVDATYLLEAGADVQKVYDYFYRFETKEHIAVINFLYNHIKYLQDGKVGYAVFSLKDMKRLGVDIEDVKSISNAIINIKGVRLAFLIMEFAPECFKFSIRTDRSCNILNYIGKFGGGGHKCAAGFELNIKRRKIDKFMRNFAEEILSE